MSRIDGGGGVAGIGMETSYNGLISSVEGDYNTLGRQGIDVWSIIARLRFDF